MNNSKFYYNILVTLNKKTEKLIIWIRNEKINYSNKKELETYVKNNCKGLKKFGNISKIIVVETTKEQYDAFDNWYIKNSKPRDFTVIYD